MLTTPNAEQQKEKAVPHIAVMGLGYVGLPLLLKFWECGSQVTGFDINPVKVAELSQGISHIEDVSEAAMQKLIHSDRVCFSDDIQTLRSADAILICVPTPLSASREPDLSFILSAVDLLTPYLQPEQLIILESTTYPGTTQELLAPRLENAGFVIGESIFLAFSPERIDPQNKEYGVGEIPKVVGGMTPACLEKGRDLYKIVGIKTHAVSSPAVAEAAKILENTFRSVNIALVNEFAQICEALQLNVWEVIEAAATKPFGFMKFSPGPGIGGHCIPLDPHYLMWKTRFQGFNPKFISLADEINREMPPYIVQRSTDLLNHQKKPLNGSRILLVGVAYKANVSDAREAPALFIWPLLEAKGAQVSYHDPHVESLKINGVVHSCQAIKSTEAYDLVIILTSHDSIDYKQLDRPQQVIFDTRNILQNHPAFEHAEVTVL